MFGTDFALNLPPEKAISYIQSKKAVIRGDYDELYSKAKAKAVLISAMTDLDMTRDIYQSMIDAQKSGMPFSEWKKNVVAHFGRKGWIAGNEKGEFLLADPKTGEFFGTPRRLEVIYRTNMQSAYAAQRYQQQRDNAVARPYWMYSAIMDARTRPSHSAMHGAVYRYDDRFWDTFYPPNGFNCRCYVRSLSERDIKRLKIDVEQSNLIDNYNKRINKHYTEQTTAAVIRGQTFTADRGFDYNPGRTAYRPNLDDYPEKLAHGFAKREMRGADFKYQYQRLENEFNALKAKRHIKVAVDAQTLTEFRDGLSINYKFAAGRISDANKAQIGLERTTAWLSDDTLIKQFNSRDGQAFGLDDYAYLPDIIYTPDHIVQDSQGYRFYKAINGLKFLVVLKILEKQHEIFVQSFRRVSERQWAKNIEK